MFKNFRFTIRMKLITFLMLIGLIPAIVVGILSLNQATKAVEDEAFAKLEMFSNFMGDTFTAFFDDRLDDVNQLAARNVLREGMQFYRDDANNPFNADYLYQLNRFAVFAEESAAKYGYTAVHLENAAGDVLYTTNPAYNGLNIAHRGYFQAAVKQVVEWSEYEYSDIINTNYIAVASPVTSPVDGTVIGVVSVVIGEDTIQHILQADTGIIGETADVYLVDQSGLLLTNTMKNGYSTDAALKQTVSSKLISEASKSIANKNIGTSVHGEYKDYLGVDVIGQIEVVHFGENAVGLAVEVDQSEAFKNVDVIKNFLLIVLAISAIITAIVGFFIANSLARPIQRVQGILEQVGNNDLTVRADVDSSDEIGQMANDLNITLDQLNESLSSVKQAVENVSHGSEEIAAGNQDLSQRTEEQAASLEQISATIEEITSSMEASSSNANEADNLSQRTLATVRQGEEVVAHLQASMEDITRGSGEIAEIISTVNDIAFQTNLLALNAAVEAARAGEQGRGFAVVASEVRNLAGRSAEAAKEIEALIKESIAQVDRGNQQMGETQRVLADIVENTQRTTDIVGEISASLGEQNIAASDIRKAIEELNQVTQQNASLVEEIASSSENMSGEAIELARLVSVFHLNDDRVGGPALTGPSSRAKKLAAPASKRSVAAKKKDIFKQDRFESDDFDFDEKDFEKF